MSICVSFDGFLYLLIFRLVVFCINATSFFYVRIVFDKSQLVLRLPTVKSEFGEKQGLGLGINIL